MGGSRGSDQKFQVTFQYLQCWLNYLMYQFLDINKLIDEDISTKLFIMSDDFKINESPSQFAEEQDVWLMYQPQRIMNAFKFHIILLIDPKNKFKDMEEQMIREFQYIHCETIEQAMEQQFSNTIIVDGEAVDIIVKLDRKNVKYVIFLYQQSTKNFEGFQLLQGKQTQKICCKNKQLNQLYQQIKQILTEIRKINPILPNFMQLNHEKWLKFHRKRMTLYSIEKPIGNNDLALNDFIQISKHLEVPDQQLKEYRNLKTQDDVLIYYTRVRCFYQIINMSLRIMVHPLQSAWFRYPYSKLRMGIKKRHQKQKTLCFIAYRGTYISDIQAKNLQKNKIYQSFGFLSTSTNPSVAQQFKTNCFITIQVNDPLKESNGFCSLQQITLAKGQEEVLFNTNNLFLIEDIYEYKYIWYIKLLLLNKPPQEFINFFKYYQQYKKADQGFVLKQFDVTTKTFYNKRRLIKQQNDILHTINQARIHSQKGYLDAAVAIYKAIFNFEQISGYHKKQQYGMILANLAGIYQKKGQDDHALKLNRRDTLHNLASVYSAKQNYKDAIVCCNETLQRYHKVYGKGHLQEAMTLKSQAINYLKINEHGQADICIQKAYKIFLQRYGMVHVVIANCLSIMGNIKLELDKIQQAQKLLSKALDLWNQIYQGYHIQAAPTICCMADVYKHKGDFVKALSLNKKALQLYNTFYGEGHIKTAWIWNDIGYIQIQNTASNTDKALYCFEKARNILHPYNIIQESWILYNLGLVSALRKEYSKAVMYLQESVKINKQHCSKEVGFQLVILYKIIYRLIQQKEYSMVVQFLKKALEAQTYSTTDNSIQILQFICSAYYQVNNFNAIIQQVNHMYHIIHRPCDDIKKTGEFILRTVKDKQYQQGKALLKMDLLFDFYIKHQTLPQSLLEICKYTDSLILATKDIQIGQNLYAKMILLAKDTKDNDIVLRLLCMAMDAFTNLCRVDIAQTYGQKAIEYLYHQAQISD